MDQKTARTAAAPALSPRTVRLRAKLFVLFACSLSILPGCVTESATPTNKRSMGITVKPGTTPVAPVPLPQVPNGPIAAPMPGATTASHVEVGVIPQGRISYDGFTLPLVSPDGQLVAAEEDEAPTWEAAVAQNGAMPPMRTRLALYKVADRALQRIPMDQNLPPGLLLGRSADDKGFLVEAPQSDGSRWIGRVAWAGGSIEWLVRGAGIACHATLSPRGELVYISRSQDSDASDLVIRTATGAESVRNGAPGWFAFPMCTPDPDVVYAMHIDQGGTDMLAIRLERGSDATHQPTFGTVLARRNLSPNADLALAYQAAITVAEPLPSATPPLNKSLAFFNPARHCMCEFRLDTASFEAIASKTQSAVASQDRARPGYFCTTPTELVFAPSNVKNSQGDQPIIPVVAGSFVPRQVRGQPESMMLFGPVKDRPDQLEVVKLVIGPTQQPAPAH